MILVGVCGYPEEKAQDSSGWRDLVPSCEHIVTHTCRKAINLEFYHLISHRKNPEEYSLKHTQSLSASQRVF